MRWRRRQRTRLTAWLGLAALAIQVLLPLVLAAEISAAAAAGEHSVFELCVFGHPHHGLAPGDADGKSDADLGTVCPICVALQASPVFTAPAIAALPLPAMQATDIAVAAARVSPRPVALAAYRSRAPPLG